MTSRAETKQHSEEQAKNAVIVVPLQNYRFHKPSCRSEHLPDTGESLSQWGEGTGAEKEVVYVKSTSVLGVTAG